MSDYYVPGVEETDLKKVIQSLQQAAGNAATAMDDTATNTADIATNAANIATNTADIAKLTNNQFARVSLITTNQTGMSNATFTVVNFNSVNIDPASIWDNTNKRFKPTVAGHYRAGFGLSMSVASSTQIVGSIFKNGAEAARGGNFVFNTTTLTVVGGDLIYMNGSTDFIDVRGYIDGGASKAFIAGTSVTYFNISLVKAD